MTRVFCVLSRLFPSLLGTTWRLGRKKGGDVSPARRAREPLGGESLSGFPGMPRGSEATGSLRHDKRLWAPALLVVSRAGGSTGCLTVSSWDVAGNIWKIEAGFEAGSGDWVVGSFYRTVRVPVCSCDRRLGGGFGAGVFAGFVSLRDRDRRVVPATR